MRSGPGSIEKTNASKHGKSCAKSRIGLTSGCGVHTAALDKALHEHGVNYLWVSVIRQGQMMQAIRNLAPSALSSLRIRV